jgi:hypothetical protein
LSRIITGSQNEFADCAWHYIHHSGDIGTAESHLLDCDDADDRAAASDRSSPALTLYLIA